MIMDNIYYYPGVSFLNLGKVKEKAIFFDSCILNHVTFHSVDWPNRWKDLCVDDPSMELQWHGPPRI